MREQNQYEALPEEDRERYRTLAAALIEHGGGALVDLDGMIVKGDDVVKDYVWIGYLKGKDSKSEAQQKVCHHRKCNDYLTSQQYWVRKIDVRVTPEDAAEGANTKASRVSLYRLWYYYTSPHNAEMQRMREEMRIAATIRHPNIMRLYGMFIDVDKLGATAYTVREPLGPS
jgi:hypothetical protein